MLTSCSPTGRAGTAWTCRTPSTSSALGMLLLLRDHAGGDNAEVNLVNCNADVRKILTISNFEQLFSIH